MKELMEQLNKAIMEVGEKAYKDAGQQGAAGDDAIETDFSAEK